MRKKIDWEEREGNSNPLVPYEIVKHIHAVLKTFTASEQSPAVLARGKPMNHHQMQNEGGGEGTPQDGEEAGIILSGDTTNLETHTQAAPQTHTHGDLPKP